ncbi:hypothetical protein C8N24_0699 [Solirubrobacter pauli]|uniref:Uncharacterized protein n=1 Tax=Solirubrobacter pauli TaxID=166793 RepID=A0A660LCW3_9ACTN|nr:hypothetical protein C8N24_0699 [Solirubrobacter pauli]
MTGARDGGSPRLQEVAAKLKSIPAPLDGFADHALDPARLGRGCQQGASGFLGLT